MSPILEFSATTNTLKNHFDVLSCFLESASTLRSIARDGIAANGEPQAGIPRNDFWNEHLITAFFLLRHAIELAVKALIKEIKNEDINGHNIKKLWEENIPNHQNMLPEKIKEAFDVLAKYNILKDEQLFRYHADNSGNKLNAMQPIPNDDFDALEIAAWAIRQKTLEYIHLREDLPL
jgi:hypothetical protein